MCAFQENRTHIRVSVGHYICLNNSFLAWSGNQIGCDTGPMLSVVASGIGRGLVEQSGGWSAGRTPTPPGTWSRLWFAGVRKCPQCVSIVGASDSASVLLYITFLSHLVPFAVMDGGRTVPREGFDLSVVPFSWCVVAVTLSYIVSVHIQCQASIYTLLLCRGHSWRVRLAKQETPTPSGHLVSPLVCRDP